MNTKEAKTLKVLLTDIQDVSQKRDSILKEIMDFIDVNVKIEPEVKTTVTVWREDTMLGGYLKSGYTFKGLPDIKRVIRETLEVGALAIKIECTEESSVRGFDSVYLWSKDVGKIKGNTYDWVDRRYYCFGASRVSIAFCTIDIESAITAYLSKQKPAPRSAHKAGEIFTGVRSKFEKCSFPKDGLEYTGEMLPPKIDEWHVNMMGEAITAEFDFATKFDSNAVREILRPIKPQFKVGDIVVRVHLREKTIQIGKLCAFYALNYWHVSIRGQDTMSTWWEREFSLATPAEIDKFYKVDIGGGVTCWANDGGGNDIHCIRIASKYKGYTSAAWFLQDVGTAICAKLGVPIRKVGE